MRMLLADSADLGLPTQELADLVQANMTDNILESVMRVRALTELSARLDTATLISFAAIAARPGNVLTDLVSALERPRH